MSPAPLDVLVVGSANLDVVLRVRSLPGPGETVLAWDRSEGVGGKGANQAVAAARAGASTALVAALGPGTTVSAALAAAGVDVGLLRTAESQTGTAFVLVDDQGENAIVVDPGANSALTLTEEDHDALSSARVVLCQLEVPLAVVTAALAAASGLRVLNAAPAADLPPELLRSVDVLVANEHEAVRVSGAGNVDDAVASLLQSVPEVVVTLGADGALLALRGEDPVRLPAVRALAVVDTTGAGDAFCGALAAARAAGMPPADAARFACAAASLSVETLGAAGSAPALAAIDARLQDA